MGGAENKKLTKTNFWLHIAVLFFFLASSIYAAYCYLDLDASNRMLPTLENLQALDDAKLAEVGNNFAKLLKGVEKVIEGLIIMVFGCALYSIVCAFLGRKYLKFQDFEGTEKREDK